ncbi:hypothetical protein NA56DRAFT_737608 [Hyaloscypha hepaticicola]|uniref:Uncharacterized protein n=1 Tax=Hyaloscypha hepaticicola TaxID=2082293 RepID=A0A2J6PH43_9HELO|nr:hypothetical protein NA56DRAFT_737608 [Hyaloscypha hepaticicola]
MSVTVGSQRGFREWGPEQAAIPRALPPPPAGIFTPNPGRSQARMHVLRTSVWQIATLLVPDPIGSGHHRQTAPASAYQNSCSGYRGNATFCKLLSASLAAGLKDTAEVALPIGCSLDESPPSYEVHHFHTVEGGVESASSQLALNGSPSTTQFHLQLQRG